MDPDPGQSRIRLRIRIQVAQKHVDPVDPDSDPQHCPVPPLKKMNKFHNLKRRNLTPSKES